VRHVRFMGSELRGDRQKTFFVASNVALQQCDDVAGGCHDLSQVEFQLVPSGMRLEFGVARSPVT
jgi:hypothetical protein